MRLLDRGFSLDNGAQRPTLHHPRSQELQEQAKNRAISFPVFFELPVSKPDQLITWLCIMYWLIGEVVCGIG